MPIQGFNPEEFAKNLTSQVVGVIPNDLAEEDKKFVINIVYKFLVLAADALNKEENSPLNAQQAATITQFIGEWAFHKSVDLSRAQVGTEQKETVLQAVAFAVFDEAKKVIINDVPNNEAVSRIEERVRNAYNSALDSIVKEGKIDPNTLKKAQEESNIDRMAQEARQQQNQEVPQAAQPQELSKPVEMPDQLLKLAAISLVLRRMKQKQVEKILSKIDPRDAQAIASYMNLEGLETKIDMEKAQKFINEFLLSIPQEAKRINEEIASSRFKQIKKKFPQGSLEHLLNKERSLLKSAMKDDEEIIKDLSPKIVNILYNYLEGKAVGYSKK